MGLEVQEYKYLTVEDVSELLKISKTTAYKLFHTTGFPATKIGRQFVIRRDVLDDYIYLHRETEIAL